MKKIVCLILCLFFWNCCPICNSDRFYTIEKSADVDAVEKYRDVDYYLNHGSYEFVDDTLQEHYYKTFCLYIDSVNVYNLSMPVFVEAYITYDGNTEKIDSSLVRYRTVIDGKLGVFIDKRMPEPSSRLKIVVTKDGKETIFEFDIVQKAYKSRHSRKWMSFISF